MQQVLSRTVMVAWIMGALAGPAYAADPIDPFAAFDDPVYGIDNRWIYRPQPPPPRAEPPPKPGPAPAVKQVLGKDSGAGVLGKEVRSLSGQDMGQIVNVIVDGSGKPLAAVIDFGGFLGVGSRKIAVDWNALHFATGDKADEEVVLDLTRDQVKAAPEYEAGKPIVVLGAAGGTKPVQH